MKAQNDSSGVDFRLFAKAQNDKNEPSLQARLVPCKPLVALRKKSK